MTYQPSNLSFDVIVVGGGHAGCEAAAAAARMGATTALVTPSRHDIGILSCNPAIGGVGKGHLVTEIDALDGLMGRVADQAAIQFRLLNRRKGAAVRGPRAQMDRQVYQNILRGWLENYDNLTIIEARVEDLIIEPSTAPGNSRKASASALAPQGDNPDRKGTNPASPSVAGVILADGVKIKGRAVVLTTGTFLRGCIHVGAATKRGGRGVDDLSLTSSSPVRFAVAPASMGLARTFARHSFRLNRLKTGTPPRLDKASIDFNGLKAQPGDDAPTMFSTLSQPGHDHQIDCHITHTNERTHAFIRRHLDRSPLYNGKVSSQGPRYCPSIEDKINRFPQAQRHQIFLEPEGRNSSVIYPNGISTSFPKSWQVMMIRTIKGLEHAAILRPGYTIAYDCIDTAEINPTLQTYRINFLYCAGQINGTTGYEEAAAQGLVAGINAARQSAGKEPIIFDRTRSYIGVLVDDISRQSLKEPYRMFTSRSEYRLRLRADNADTRLTDRGIDLGCISQQRQLAWAEKNQRLENGRQLLRATMLSAQKISQLSITSPRPQASAWDLLQRSDISIADIKRVQPLNIDPLIGDILSIEAHYAPYMRRQDADIEAMERDHQLILAPDIDFDQIPCLSHEARQALKKRQPKTLGLAARLPGMTPAATIALLRYIQNVPRGTFSA